MEHKCKNADLEPIEKCALNREQIIKALELHANAEKSCVDECPYGNMRRCGSAMAKDALSLINELTEENERLEDNLIKQITENIMLLIERKDIKADTVRKMQERITKHATNGYPRKVRLDVIDQIAKEMVGGIE